MAAWASIRSIHINNWNETKVLVAGNPEKTEVGDVFEDPSYSIREAFIKKKSVTFFTLGSDPPPILRKV